MAGQGFQAVGQRSQFGSELALGGGQLQSGLAQRLGILRGGVGERVGGGFLSTAQAQEEIDAAAAAQQSSFFNKALGVVGTVGGAALGGPIGASIGKRLAA